ncbi:MAG: hypothetical protein ACTSU2_01405 [Promethearchaeota archaeon]
MKFRAVFKTKTKKNKDLIFKLKVPPSKHLGLINFLNTALRAGNDVIFTIEKVDKDKHREESSIYGVFRLMKKGDDKDLIIPDKKSQKKPK